MADPISSTELRQLELNIAASHNAIVTFLEEAAVPWSDDQMAELEHLILAEHIALSVYETSVGDLRGRPSKPLRLRMAADQLATRKAGAALAGSRPWPRAFGPHIPAK